MQEETRPRRKLSTLWQLARFVRPYRGTLFAAGVALVFTAGVTLSIGQGLRILIDDGNHPFG